MTMYKYNPSQPDKSDNIEAVRNAAHGYLPNEIVIDESAFSCFKETINRLTGIEADDYWCSYDSSSDCHNFHIVPNVDDSKGFCEAIGKLGCDKGPNRRDWPWTYAHRYSATERIEGYDYFYSFNRLVVNEEEKTVSNHLGKMQICRVEAGRKGPNFSEDGSFKMMYPKSAENGDCESDEVTGHCVYNAPLTISSSPTDIAREFRRFIGLWEHADFIRSLKHSSGSCEDILNAVEKDELLKAIVCWEFKVQSHQ